MKILLEMIGEVLIAILVTMGWLLFVVCPSLLAVLLASSARAEVLATAIIGLGVTVWVLAVFYVFHRGKTTRMVLASTLSIWSVLTGIAFLLFHGTRIGP